jgi:glucose-1-phosphate thymidylyltransferase
MHGYRKGIILAGGAGTRLNPMTRTVNKQLLPIYDKPLVYYPLSTLMASAVTDVLIISSPDQLDNFRRLFGSGEHLGMNITYAGQSEPRGLADAFLIGRDVGFLKDGGPVALALGDNIFYGEDFYRDLMYISKMNTNWVFGYRVSNPKEYGVVDFEPWLGCSEGTVKVKDIEEKPEYPKSNYAVPGLYFYDDTVVQRAEALEPSDRGELEITDLNNSYIRDGKLNVKILKDSSAWFDTGTADAMFEASMFVKSIQSRTGQMIGCIEEIARKMGNISENEFRELVQSMPRSQYKSYLLDKHGMEVIL